MHRILRLGAALCVVAVPLSSARINVGPRVTTADVRLERQGQPPFSNEPPYISRARMGSPTLAPMPQET
jgi:hypothetical protein